MNRSILIVICDFLLISMLAFSTVDPKALTDQRPNQTMRLELGSPPTSRASTLKKVRTMVETGGDLANQDLSNKLWIAQFVAKRQQTQIWDKEARLRTNDALIKATTALASNTLMVASSQSNTIQALSKNLTNTQGQLSHATNIAARLSNDLVKTDAELKAERDHAGKLGQSLKSATDANHILTVANSQIAENYTNMTSSFSNLYQDNRELLNQMTILQREVRDTGTNIQTTIQATGKQVDKVAGTAAVIYKELAALSTNLGRNSKEVSERLVQIANKARELNDTTKELAKTVDEGQKKLETNLTVITKHIPLSPNEVYSEYLTNRVEVSFSAFAPGIGDQPPQKYSHTVQTVLVSLGRRTFALCHTSDTPLDLHEGFGGSVTHPPVDWRDLVGTIRHGKVTVAIQALAFLALDPRVALFEIGPQQVGQLHVKVYPVSDHPDDFDQALVVRTGEEHSKDSKFVLTSKYRHYYEMDHSFFKALGGGFTPSRGDLVLSKKGVVLGVLVDNHYCLVPPPAEETKVAAAVVFGSNLTTRTSTVVKEMRATVKRSEIP